MKMYDNRHGSGLIMIILALLVIGIASTMSMKTFAPAGSANGPSPIQRSWDAVCATNRTLISQQLQIRAMNNAPMDKLDLQTLFSGSFNLPAGCPCSYTFDAAGNVACKAHPR